MDNKNHLITLEGLKSFWTKAKTWIEEKLSVLDKKIDRQIFQGTEAELQAAIAAGLVDENTLIILDEGKEQPIYELCTTQDIEALFQTPVA